MNPSTCDSPSRRAALTLHALPAQDRDWVLAALPAAHRVLLQPLLDELRELGLPREPALVAQACARRAVAPAGPLDAMGEARLAGLAALLAQEPPALAATLLRAANWTWRQQLADLLPPSHAGGFPGVTGAAAPLLEQAVIEALASRIPADADRGRPRRWRLNWPGARR